jgi:hypothetical protein
MVHWCGLRNLRELKVSLGYVQVDHGQTNSGQRAHAAGMMMQIGLSDRSESVCPPFLLEFFIQPASSTLA